MWQIYWRAPMPSVILIKLLCNFIEIAPAACGLVKVKFMVFAIKWLYFYLFHNITSKILQSTDFFIINRGRFGSPLNLRLFLMIEYFISYINSKQEEWYKDFMVEKDKLRISKLLCCKIMNRMASPSFVGVNLLWAILILSNKFGKILIFSCGLLYFFTNFIEKKIYWTIYLSWLVKLVLFCEFF